MYSFLFSSVLNPNASECDFHRATLHLLFALHSAEIQQARQVLSMVLNFAALRSMLRNLSFKELDLNAIKWHRCDCSFLSTVTTHSF